MSDDRFRSKAAELAQTIAIHTSAIKHAFAELVKAAEVLRQKRGLATTDAERAYIDGVLAETEELIANHPPEGRA